MNFHNIFGERGERATTPFFEPRYYERSANTPPSFFIREEWEGLDGRLTIASGWTVSHRHASASCPPPRTTCTRSKECWNKMKLRAWPLTLHRFRFFFLLYSLGYSNVGKGARIVSNAEIWFKRDSSLRGKKKRIQIFTRALLFVKFFQFLISRYVRFFSFERKYRRSIGWAINDR